MSDLVQKLRDVPVLYGVQKRLNHEAADRIEADEALMRQAWEALEAISGWQADQGHHRNAIAALRERLGEKP